MDDLEWKDIEKELTEIDLSKVDEKIDALKKCSEKILNYAEQKGWNDSNVKYLLLRICAKWREFECIKKNKTGFQDSKFNDCVEIMKRFPAGILFRVWTLQFETKTTEETKKAEEAKKAEETDETKKTNTNPTPYNALFMAYLSIARKSDTTEQTIYKEALEGMLHDMGTRSLVIQELLENTREIVDFFKKEEISVQNREKEKENLERHMKLIGEVINDCAEFIASSIEIRNPQQEDLDQIKNPTDVIGFPAPMASYVYRMVNGMQEDLDMEAKGKKQLTMKDKIKENFERIQTHLKEKMSKIHVTSISETREPPFYLLNPMGTDITRVMDAEPLSRSKLFSPYFCGSVSTGSGIHSFDTSTFLASPRSDSIIILLKNIHVEYEVLQSLYISEFKDKKRRKENTWMSSYPGYLIFKMSELEWILNLDDVDAPRISKESIVIPYSGIEQFTIVEQDKELSIQCFEKNFRFYPIYNIPNLNEFLEKFVRVSDRNECPRMQKLQTDRKKKLIRRKHSMLYDRMKSRTVGDDLPKSYRKTYEDDKEYYNKILMDPKSKEESKSIEEGLIEVLDILCGEKTRKPKSSGSEAQNKDEYHMSKRNAGLLEFLCQRCMDTPKVAEIVFNRLKEIIESKSSHDETAKQMLLEVCARLTREDVIAELPQELRLLARQECFTKQVLSDGDGRNGRTLRQFICKDTQEKQYNMTYRNYMSSVYSNTLFALPKEPQQRENHESSMQPVNGTSIPSSMQSESAKTNNKMITTDLRIVRAPHKDPRRTFC